MPIKPMLIRMLTILIALLGYPIALVTLATMPTPPDSGTGPALRPWQQAMAAIHQTRGLVATRIETHMVVRDGKDKPLGTVATVETVTWQDDKPVWVTLSKIKTGAPGFTLTMVLGFEKDPSTVLDGYEKWTPAGEHFEGGKLLMVWKAERSKDEPTVALVYLEALTSLPLHVDYFYTVNSYGIDSFKVTVDYGRDENGAWVPTRALIDQAGRFMFWKRHLTITKTFHDWTERPR